MQKCKQMLLFTTRNCLCFDENGEQIGEYQRAITCYKINKKLALQATTESEEFYIGQWREWEHPITQREMQYLLGIRTRKMEL